MKKLCFLVAVVIFTLTSSTALAVDEPLIAGQYYDIGTVRVTNDANNLYVDYILDGDCEVWGDLAETHLHVAQTEPEIPQNKKGNPQIGLFEYSGAMSFTIPLASIPAVIGDTIVIAAHAVGPGWDELADALPEEVKLIVYGYGTNPYLEIEIYDDGILDGFHDAWCLDVYEDVEIGDFNAVVYAGVIAPEIDWLLNNYMDYIGQTSDQGDPYVPGDIQAAIWLLTSGMPDYNLADPNFSKWAWGLYHWGDWTDHDAGPITPPDPGNRDAYDANEYNDDVARSQEIADDALLYGEGYEPGCCDVTGVILVPYIENGEIEYLQPLLIPVPAPCDETAWGDGIDGIPLAPTGNNGKRSGSWAKYFEYVLAAPLP